MYKRIAFLSSMTLIGISSADAQFQVVHDVPDTDTYPPTIRTIVTSDGGMITLQRVDSTHLFRKYDAQGGLLWNKVLQDTSALPPVFDLVNNNITAMAMTDNGGCVFAQYVGKIETSSFPPEPPDSAWTYFNVMELDGAGALINSIQIEKFHDYLPMTSVHSLDLRSMPDGEVHLLATYQDGASGFLELYKIQADGTMAWSRSVGNDYGGIFLGSSDPTYSYALHPEARMMVDPQGNSYIIDRSMFGGAELFIWKLAPDGSLLWMNQYNYSNVPTGISLEGLDVDGNGSLLGGGLLTNSVGRFAFFCNIDPDGTMLDLDIYRLPDDIYPQYHGGAAGFDTMGRRYYKADHIAGNSSSETQFILQADTIGSPALFLRRNDQVILPNNVFVPLQHMDVHEDRMAVTAVLNHEHVDFAFTTRYETALLFDTDDLFSCILTDSTLEHIAVPLEIITTSQPADAASIDISAYVDAYPITDYTISDLPTEPLEDLCTFAYNLLGIEIGLEEESPTGWELVRMTAIPAGSPIELIRPDVTRIELYNVNGQLLLDRTIGMDHNVTTDRIPTGIFFIRGHDRVGTVIGVQRLLIF